MVLESIDILKDKGYITIKKLNVSQYIQMTARGFLFYAENSMDDFESKYKKVISSIMNDEQRNSSSIEKETNVEISLIEALLEYFELKGFIRKTNTFGGMIISDVSGTGKRHFREQLS
ncbi:MAG: toll/interleukin-1 receptor domain-containing protein partial [Methanobrevibacter sp. CfCl-M3]